MANLKNLTEKTRGSFTISSEVKKPPISLQAAAQIGMLQYENENLRDAPNKDAILILSFGTTNKISRAKTVEATFKTFRNAFKSTRIALSFTSHIVLSKIAQNEGYSPYSAPEDTLENLLREGFTRIALVPLAIIPGIEYKYDVAIFHEFKTRLKKMTLATPLIYWQGQENYPDDISEVTAALDLPAPENSTAILLMAHGTPDPSNAYYSVIQEKLSALRNDAFIYTVEGFPRLEHLIDKLKNFSKIILQPLMLVAGDHANNDMAGEHKDFLIRAGFQVEVKLQGLGENPKIRNIYVKRAAAALELLVS
mgnify:CR=1 FL=1